MTAEQDLREKLRVRHLHVSQTGVDPGFAFSVNHARKREALDEPADLAWRHGLLLQVDEMNRDAALFEKPFGGAGRR